MRKILYITAAVAIALAPGATLVGCAGVSGVKELKTAPESFIVQHEYTAADGTVVQQGLLNGNPERLGQRQESPDGVVVWLEQIDPWVAKAAGDAASTLGFGSLSGALTALLVLGGKSLSDRKWKNPA